jgi:hypothetical protein
MWGLDILGLFPRAVGGFRYLYVTIDKFTKWSESTFVVKINKQSTVKFIKSIIYMFMVSNRIITDNGPSSLAAHFKDTVRILESKSAMCLLLIQRVMNMSRELMLKSSRVSRHTPMTT